MSQVPTLNCKQYGFNQHILSWLKSYLKKQEIASYRCELLIIETSHQWGASGKCTWTAAICHYHQRHVRCGQYPQENFHVVDAKKLRSHVYCLRETPSGINDPDHNSFSMMSWKCKNAMKINPRNSYFSLKFWQNHNFH